MISVSNCWRRVHKEMGGTRPIPDDVWDRLDEVSFPAVIQYLEPRNARVLDYVRHLFAGMRSETYRPALFDGIDDVLRTLATYGSIAIMSATPGSVIRRVLDDADSVV